MTNQDDFKGQDFEKSLSQSSVSVAAFDTERRDFLHQLQQFLHSSPAIVPLFVLVAATAAFSIIVGPKFYSPFALTLILQQVAITGIVAMAETLIILTAGIDLSVGAIMVLTSVVMGRVAMIDGWPTMGGLLILLSLIGVARALVVSRGCRTMCRTC